MRTIYPSQKSQSYKKWREDLNLLPLFCSQEVYDHEEEVYYIRRYITKSYLWGLIKVRKPVAQVVCRYWDDEL